MLLIVLQSRSLPRQPSASKKNYRGFPQRQISISTSKAVAAWRPSHKDDKKKDGEEDAEIEVKKMAFRERFI